MDYKLTGRKRYRMDKDKIVLQVEYSFLHTDEHDYETCYSWRDAKLEDLTIDTDVTLNIEVREKR